jgi:hypothetical protein
MINGEFIVGKLIIITLEWITIKDAVQNCVNYSRNYGNNGKNEKHFKKYKVLINIYVFFISVLDIFLSHIFI